MYIIKFSLSTDAILMCVCRTKYSYIQCCLNVMFLTTLYLRHIRWDFTRFNFTHNSGFLSCCISCPTECHYDNPTHPLPPNVNVVSCPFKVSFSISPKSQFFLIPYYLSLNFFLHFFLYWITLIVISSYSHFDFVLSIFPNVTKIWI